MAGNKTRFTDASGEACIASHTHGHQAADGHALMALFETLTGQPPTMVGPGIVGHGSYRYACESGRTGEAPLAGFASRGRELVIYLDCGEDDTPLPANLGKHRMDKSCLYFGQLTDLGVSALVQRVAGAMTRMQQR
ncbi:DUF1801 domain-containing protein [Stenotrophomonas sp. MYb238]|uniref:DUF1801 domain-containing protein n=1 Tax=Stenotrophomonas sp. MYb238 TaxID=2040281 RepID=UPI001291665F|nr:DUF1801 domain-containing protein [Stenotrophomonas sp. MYb238]MQP75972.1 DUF1801 domain-containing protein [Stenotrophomonas sp. MYb238]